jgi:V/A-type H+-transporting ATPase subunit F
MKRVVFLTAGDARFGFSLAGMAQLAIEPRQAEQALRQAIADQEVAVVVIDERLAREIPEGRFNELEGDWQGLIVTLPAPSPVAGGAEDRLQRLIRRALGYHVRLQL